MRLEPYMDFGNERQFSVNDAFLCRVNRFDYIRLISCLCRFFGSGFFMEKYRLLNQALKQNLCEILFIFALVVKRNVAWSRQRLCLVSLGQLMQVGSKNE